MDDSAGFKSVAASCFDLQALARALDGLPSDKLDIALIATTPDGTVSYWNSAAERLYGWTAPEALGANVIELKATDDSLSRATEVMARLQAGLSWTGEINLKKRGGGEFRAFAADIPLGAVENGRGLIVGASANARRRQAVEDFQPSMLAALRYVAVTG